MVPGKCCFCLPLRTSVLLFGLLSMTFSLCGIVVSTSSVLQHFKRPDDRLLLRLLTACYFLDVQGIAFHAVLFIVSTVLEFGALSEIPPLLLPWLIGCPFLVTAIVLQMILVVAQQPDVALPASLFCMLIVLLVVYASIAVAAYHRRLSIASGRVQLRIFNLGEGELPRVVDVPRRLLMARFGAREDILMTEQPGSTSTAAPGSSDRPVSSSSEMGRRLTDAYARFVANARQEERSASDAGTTRF